MPQLERGGKYVFGWSVLRPDGSVLLPPEAVAEYELPQDGTVVVLFWQQDLARHARGLALAP